MRVGTLQVMKHLVTRNDKARRKKKEEELDRREALAFSFDVARALSSRWRRSSRCWFGQQRVVDRCFVAETRDQMAGVKPYVVQ